MSKVKTITIRNILNSNGDWAIEADVVLADGYLGRASASAAILPGRREKNITSHIKQCAQHYQNEIVQLQEREFDQQSWDSELEKRREQWGTDLTLALSLAFARANAVGMNMELVEYIRMCGKMEKRDNMFSILVPVFSGGVHNPELGGSMQQIMMSVRCPGIMETVILIRSLYTLLYETVKRKGYFIGYSASSGFLTDGVQAEEELEILSEMIWKEGLKDRVTIALDVAAEHLLTAKGYQIYHRQIEPEYLRELLQSWAFQYPVSYIEDPFDSSHETLWKELRQVLQGKAILLSDDLSATQMHFLNRDIADGLIIKMKQVGTLSATLDTVKLAQRYGMKTCVSHRSHETEDTFICDLGIAAAADYMKIGGPRRGDRVEKYNQLIRLCEKSSIRRGSVWIN